MQYADKLAEILGEEIFSVFSFDVRKYSKERILIYAVIFGVSYEEIAKTTHSNIGTVKSRIARGRIKLQEALKNYI